VIFATAVDPRGAFKQISGLAIGFTIAFGVLMAYALTGGAMNPARAFGPQLVGRHWANWWVWYVGPFTGAVIAAATYELFYLRTSQVVAVGPPETGVEEARPGDAATS
jgi:glycerol uptake facilitator-like aquaporin